MGTTFDRCRSVRYQQLLQQQRQLQQKKQRLNAIQVICLTKHQMCSITLLRWRL